jgi:site-specific DNA recombinase
VLAGLRERMMAPELVAAFIDEFNAEMRRLTGDAAAERNGDRRPVAEAERKIAAIVKAIEDSAHTPALNERLAALERQKQTAAARLAAASPKPVIRLHPNLAEMYKTKLVDLAAALIEPVAAAEAGEILRSLIDRIVLTPVAGVLKAELWGDLARITAFASAEHATSNAGSAGEPALLSVVAGTGNQRYLQALRVRVPTISRHSAMATRARIPLDATAVPIDTARSSRSCRTNEQFQS